MNKIQSLLSKRFKLFKFINPIHYFKHPEYKTPQPKGKLNQLLLMRDLRLWVIENIHWSDKVAKYYSECQHLQKEIQSLEWKSKFIFRLLSSNTHRNFNKIVYIHSLIFILLL
jgi:hypothetical protein